MTSAGQRDQRPPPRRPLPSRAMLVAGLVVLLLAAAIVVTRAGPWERPGAAGRRPGQDGQAAPRPLPGVPLRDASGLRLLVANDPAPFVLDVGTGAIRPVTGLPADGERSVHVEPVGEDAVVVTRRDCRGSDCDAEDSAAYLVRRGDTAATWLGAASDVESARDGRGVWLLTADGAMRRLPEVVDGVAGGDLVLSTLERGRLIALTDLRGGTSHRLRWPSMLQDHLMGLIDRHPDGRLVSVAFYPARDHGEQTLDIWLLDLGTRRWRHLPDMPLRLAPSKPQATWTADGRLLVLAELAGERAGLVAVWRPGEPRIAVRRVRFPVPGPPSGLRFVLW